MTGVLACAGTGGNDRERRRGYRRVLAPVAFEILHDTPGLFILDLRSNEEFQSGHLQRAVNIPLAELENRLAELQALHGETFLVYCRDDSCGPSGIRLLRQRGFEDMILIEDGFEGWTRGGFGTSNSSRPDGEGEAEAPGTGAARSGAKGSAVTPSY